MMCLPALWGSPVVFAFSAFGYIGLMNCAASDLDKPAVEAELEHAKLLETGLTPEDLARRVRADLRWQDDDGAQLYLWTSERNDQHRWSFTIDRAYRLRREGTVVWGFLDAKAGETWPAPEYLKLRHVRTTFECPTKDHPDGNHTYAELLASRHDGTAVFKVVYASLAGDRAGQEEIRTYLVYRDTAGQWRLACRNIGHEGCTAGWSSGFSDATEMQVIWNAKSDSRPFTVRLKRACHYFGRSPETADQAYQSCREGVMEGTLPMRLRMERKPYVIANGTDSLRTLGDRLTRFHSDWWNAPWVDNPQETKRRIGSEWTAALEQANPDLHADTVPEKGRHIIIPDRESTTARSIFDKLSPLVRKATTTNDAE